MGNFILLIGAVAHLVPHRLLVLCLHSDAVALHSRRWFVEGPAGGHVALALGCCGSGLVREAGCLSR